MTRTALENAIRAWLVAAGVYSGVPNPDRAVIVADQNGTRPPLPYLAVRVIAFDIPVGEDESLVDDGDPPMWRGRGQRTSTVSVHAYGDGAEAWIERATFLLGAPSVRTLLTSAGLNVQPTGALQNLSRVRDERVEVRFHRDFTAAYVRESAVEDQEVLVELAVVEHEDTLGDLVQTHTIEVA